MRFSTLEIRWHDTKPIFSCDFQPFECLQHKRQLNPYQRTADNVSDGDGKLWRVATAGGDNNVRVCLAFLLIAVMLVWYRRVLRNRKLIYLIVITTTMFT